jgi:tRNA threonylcarbamoyladenosine biosynthesis protein TsaB
MGTVNILAIETATEVCGIAYYENDSIKGIEEKIIPRQHATSLPLFYKALQDKTGLSLNALDGIAVSMGPGSFTGLRIGLSYAKGLAFSHDLPIIPVPTLQAIAFEVHLDDEFHVLVFSHRDMIYHQKFSADHQHKSNAVVSKWSDLKPLIENSTCFHIKCDTFLEDHDRAHKVQPSAKNIGALAIKYYHDWVEEKPYALVPNYIAPFEINTPK